MNPIGWLDDYRAILDATGTVALPHWSRIELRGRDRNRLLNSLATNRFDDLIAGQGRETFLTDSKGHILAHGLIVADEESTSFLSASPNGDGIADHFRKYIIREDVQVVDQSEQTAILYVGGRGTESLWQAAGIASPRAPGDHVEAMLNDVPVKVCRVDMAGPVGFLLVVPGGHTQLVAAVLQQFGAKACAGEAFDSARIQWGWPVDRVDIASDNFPQEVGRDDLAVSFTKGCYLGQETIARIDALGHVNRHLSVVRFPESQHAVAATLTAEGKAIGATTSVGYSPESACVVALGYVRREWSKAGTTVDSSLGRAEIVVPRRLAEASRVRD